MGATFSPDFPTTSGSFLTAYAGGPYDAFVTKYTATAMPVAALSPSSYDFGNLPVGTTSSPEAITLTNNGNTALAISSVTASGDFTPTNTCGSSVAAGSSCTISITFSPSATGSRPGSITITDNASPPSQTITLTGTGTAPLVSLSATTLNFTAQAVGTSSSPQAVTLTNTGSATLTLTSIASSGDFSQTNTCGSSVAAGANCAINITFSPMGTGSRNGSISLTDNDPATQTINLSGTGTAPSVSFSPSSLNFPAQAVGTSSSPQTVTLTNTGGATLTITSIASSGDFSQTNTCGSSVAAGANCAINITFAPTTTGSRGGSITVVDNASPATQTVNLSGTGTAPQVSLAPTSLSFPAQPVGASGNSTQTIALTNTGGATLAITSITTSGDFSQTNSCGSSLAASASCSISVTFKPTTTGTRTGTLTVTDNASPATQSVNLLGTGTAPMASLSPASLNFPAQLVGTSSTPQALTLANPGSATLAISSIAASGTFSQTNNCGSSLAPSASCTISVTFTPTAAVASTGAITVTDNASPATQTASITGSGAAPAARLSPTSLSFPSQAVGASSNPQPLSLTNAGNAALTITSITASGDFSQSNTCGSSLAAGASCTINATFKPSASGTRTGVVTVADNASPATQSASLSGNGILAPIANLSPTSLTFSAKSVGSSSTPQTVTLKNPGKVTLNITSIKTSGDFSQTHTCGSTLAANASCTISVSFKPTATGTRTGSLTFTDNASPTTQTVSLTGTGAGPLASLTPASLVFTSKAVGTSSSPQNVTLTNTGTASLSISSFKTSGDFSQTHTCGSSLSAGASCTISVTFKPTASGTRTGTLTVNDNASPTTQTVSLTGTIGAKTSVIYSPTSLTFSGQPVGTSSAAQNVILTNTGDAALNIAGIAANGDSAQTNNCNSSVAAGASCTLSVAFSPTGAGPRTGNVTVTDTADDSPQTISLTGTGEDFSMSALSGSSTSATVSAGGTATYALGAAAVGGFNQSVVFSCSGAPSQARCTVSPASANLGSSPTTVTVTVATTAASASHGIPRVGPLPPFPPRLPRLWLLWTMALLACGSLAGTIQGRMFPGARRNRRALAVSAALFLAILAMAACGGGGNGGGKSAPPSSNPGTPSGVYAIAATGTCSACSPAFSHTVTLTLQVQ